MTKCHWMNWYVPLQGQHTPNTNCGNTKDIGGKDEEILSFFLGHFMIFKGLQKDSWDYVFVINLCRILGCESFYSYNTSQ